MDHRGHRCRLRRDRQCLARSSRMSITRKSRGAAQRPSYSTATRHGESQRISLNCRNSRERGEPKGGVRCHNISSRYADGTGSRMIRMVRTCQMLRRHFLMPNTQSGSCAKERLQRSRSDDDCKGSSPADGFVLAVFARLLIALRIRTSIEERKAVDPQVRNLPLPSSRLDAPRWLHRYGLR